MLKIKLARFGKRNQPHYRIVVSEGKSKRDGHYQAAIGRYVPTHTPKILEVDVVAFDTWVTKGAQPTDTVKGLVDRFKTGNPFPAKKARPSKKSIAKAAAAKEAETQASAEPAPETAPESSETETSPTEPAPEAAPSEETPAEEKAAE